MNEFSYPQEVVYDWMRTCDELQERNRELREELQELPKAIAKEVLEKVWDNTYEKEVGIRWILLKTAREYGVVLDRRLKKYGECKN